MSGKTYADEMRKLRRRTILDLLARSKDNNATTEMLTIALDGIGLDTNRDQLNAEVFWLDDCAMVTFEDFGGFITVTATPYGIDIGLGDKSHDGVAEPRRQRAT